MTVVGDACVVVLTLRVVVAVSGEHCGSCVLPLVSPMAKVMVNEPVPVQYTLSW
ncbi:hypothetical protein [Kineococcus esterisolvens]|uniref:hypothetical protein n=1 Tax=unclassified Kineococcus TaxID=2621656 RepID=UPI003D7DC9C4